MIVVGTIGHDARHGEWGDDERYAAQIIDDALRGKARRAANLWRDNTSCNSARSVSLVQN